MNNQVVNQQKVDFFKELNDLLLKYDARIEAECSRDGGFARVDMSSVSGNWAESLFYLEGVAK